MRILLALPFTLAACADLTPEQSAETAAALNTLRASVNEAGVDPLQVSEERRRELLGACALLSIGAVLRGNEDTGKKIAAYCEALEAALAPAE